MSRKLPCQKAKPGRWYSFSKNASRPRSHVERVARIGGVDEAAVGLAAAGEDLLVACADSRHLLGADRRVAERRAPVRRALEHRELADRLRDLGDRLHRGRAGPDHGHALVREAHGLVRPQARVPPLAPEVLDAVDPRHGRRRERAERGHEDARAGAQTTLERDVPLPRALVPPRRDGALAEGDVAAQVELVGDELAVAQVLRLTRELLAPAPPAQDFVVEREDVGPALRVEARARVAVPVGSAAAGLCTRTPVRGAQLVERTCR
jgi:hypothetical protein